MAETGKFHSLTLGQKDAVGRFATHQFLSELTYDLPGMFNLTFSSSAHHDGREKLAEEWQALENCELSTRMECSLSMSLEKVFRHGLYSEGGPPDGDDVRNLVRKIREHMRCNNPWSSDFLADSADNAYSQLIDRLEKETEYWPASAQQCG